MASFKQQRYQDLLANGLRDWEAQVLQVIPLRVPYLATLKTARAKQVKRLQAQGYTDAQIDAAIVRGYAAKGYTKQHKSKSPEIVWDMLRGIEAPFKKANPDYQPKYHHKRDRDTARTMDKINNTLNKMSKNQLTHARDTTSDAKQWRRYNDELRKRGE